MAIYQFEYHTFLHHSQTVTDLLQEEWEFEYHTFLHHSQTLGMQEFDAVSLSTIHFYIILKLLGTCLASPDGLSTIHFYIILKPQI